MTDGHKLKKLVYGSLAWTIKKRKTVHRRGHLSENGEHCGRETALLMVRMSAKDCAIKVPKEMANEYRNVLTLDVC